MDYLTEDEEMQLSSNNENTLMLTLLCQEKEIEIAEFF